GLWGDQRRSAREPRSERGQGGEGSDTMTRDVTVQDLAGAVGAYGGNARGPEVYQADTRMLLDVRQSQIVGWFKQALASDATVAAKVRVKLVVEKKTGMVTNAVVDPQGTTAPEPLQKCVLDALAGLKLDPPDKNEGQATFEYAFQPSAAS